MAYDGIRVQLDPTGLEPGQSETETAILAGVRRFADKVLRPIGRQLDELHDPNQVIAADSPLWKVFGEFQALGLTVEAIFDLPADERGRLMSSAFEELGWGDGGLAIGIKGDPDAVALTVGHRFWTRPRRSQLSIGDAPPAGTQSPSIPSARRERPRESATDLDHVQ